MVLEALPLKKKKSGAPSSSLTKGRAGESGGTQGKAGSTKQAGRLERGREAPAPIKRSASEETGGHHKRVAVSPGAAAVVARGPPAEVPRPPVVAAAPAGVAVLASGAAVPVGGEGLVPVGALGGGVAPAVGEAHPAVPAGGEARPVVPVVGGAHPVVPVGVGVVPAPQPLVPVRALVSPFARVEANGNRIPVWSPDPMAVILWLEGHSRPFSFTLLLNEIREEYRGAGDPDRIHRAVGRAEIALRMLFASVRYHAAPRLSDDESRESLVRSVLQFLD